MRSIYRFKKNSNYVILISILGIFILSFSFINYIYMLNSKKAKTVVIDKSLFSSSQPNSEAGGLRIENVARKDLNYSIFSPSILANDSAIFISYDKNNKEKICVLNIDNNNLDEIYKTSEGNFNNFAVSQDGKKIIYSDIDSKKNTGKTYLYDIETKEAKEIMNGVSYAGIITDNNKYIGINDDYLFVMNINTGNVENLMDMSKISNALDEKISRKVKMMYKLKLSKNGNILYFDIRTVEGSYEIYSTVIQINLKNKEILQYPIKGDISNFEPLDNGNFIFCGKIGESSGIFIYNVKNKYYKNIKQGNIVNIELTQDNRKIAYINSNNDGSTELHAAAFLNDEIESDINVYTSPKYNTRFNWSNDGQRLFYFTNSNNISTIYRFSFEK